MANQANGERGEKWQYPGRGESCFSLEEAARLGVLGKQNPEPQLPAAASKETSVGTVVHSMAKWERGKGCATATSEYVFWASSLSLPICKDTWPGK